MSQSSRCGSPTATVHPGHIDCSLSASSRAGELFTDSIARISFTRDASVSMATTLSDIEVPRTFRTAAPLRLGLSGKGMVDRHRSMVTPEPKNASLDWTVGWQ